MTKPREAQNWMAQHLRTDHSSQCVTWPFVKDRKGYGRLYGSVDGVRVYLATHWVLHLTGQGRPSPQHMALHSCDNPPCVNPNHLRWGTAKENTQEMVTKGRARGGNTRLTPEEVREIRNARGVIPQKALAVRYGVSTPTICEVQLLRKHRGVT